MIYELKNGKFTAQVDSYGAQLASLKGADGTEYLWVGDPAYWREHAPVLFPIVGALRENKAKIHGEWGGDEPPRLRQALGVCGEGAAGGHYRPAAHRQ